MEYVVDFSMRSVSGSLKAHYQRIVDVKVNTEFNTVTIAEHLYPNRIKGTVIKEITTPIECISLADLVIQKYFSDDAISSFKCL